MDSFYFCLYPGVYFVLKHVAMGVVGDVAAYYNIGFILSR